MEAPMKSIWVSDMLNVMERAMKSRLTKYCFLLGAGASFTSEIPTGEDLMKQWRDELLEQEKSHPGYIQSQARLAQYDWEECKPLFDPGKKLPNEAYFTLYDLKFACLSTEGYQFLQNQMKGKTPSPGYYYLAKLLMETKNNLVITTNFDPMTEEALFDVQRVHPLLLSHESLASYLNIDTERPIVAKIHRDLLLQPMNRETELQKLQEQWVVPLTQVLTHYTPIVVGYAGGDQTLMTLLEELKEQLPGIFWCTLKGKELPPRAQKILEANTNGRWVEIDGFDELMFQIAQRLGYLPVPKKLRQSAKKRLDTFQKKDEQLRQKYQSAPANAKADGTPQDTGMQQAVLQEEAKQAAETGDPKADYYRHLAEAVRLRSMGQLEAALEECNEAIRLQPNDALPYNNRGVILHNMGRYPDALEDYTRAIQLQPDYAIAYANHSTTLHEIGLYEEALEDDNRAIKLQPDNPDFYEHRVIILDEMGRYEEALEDCNQAIKLQPDNPDFYEHRAFILHKMDRYEEALEDCNHAIKLQPDSAEFYHGRGIILCRMERYEEALEDHNHAIKLQPNNAKFYDIHGVTLHVMGRYQEALEDHNHAIQLQPDNADFYDGRAITLRAMGREDEARADEECAEALRNPKQP